MAPRPQRWAVYRAGSVGFLNIFDFGSERSWRLKGHPEITWGRADPEAGRSLPLPSLMTDASFLRPQLWLSMRFSPLSALAIICTGYIVIAAGDQMDTALAARLGYVCLFLLSGSAAADARSSIAFVFSGSLCSTLNIVEQYKDAEIFDALRRVHLIREEEGGPGRAGGRRRPEYLLEPRRRGGGRGESALSL